MITLTKIMEMIELQAEVQNQVQNLINNFKIGAYEEDIIKLLNINEANDAKNRLKEAFAPDLNNLKILTSMLYALRYTYQNYKSKGISDLIFIDTMKAFPRFINEHYQATKSFAFDRDWWSYRQIAMTIFRIGQLEFEMKDVDGKKYISIHIPSDAKMQRENVFESFKDSYVFFETYYPEFANLDYVCRSWLLSSDLKNVLQSDSNIINFQNLFNIISESYNSTSFIKWIYKADYTDYHDLPEDTSLQRNLKQYLLNGNSLGVAYGIIDKTKIL